MHRDMITVYKSILNKGTQLRMWYDRGDYVEIQTYDQEREVVPVESISLAGTFDYYKGPIRNVTFTIPKGLCKCKACQNE